MTIAENIKATFNHSGDWDLLFTNCEHHAEGDIDQDYEKRSNHHT